jgi:Imidazoleglycerol-phosphate dehydratase
MSERQATTTGSTGESTVTVQLNVDGKGECRISSGIGYFDALLRMFAHHAKFDIKVDVEVDDKLEAHMVETIGHCLGLALTKALGNKKGITRFAFSIVPLEEALARVVLDLSGRPYLVWNVPIPVDSLGSFDSYLGLEFMRRFVMAGGINMHVDLLEPGSPHHVFDAIFVAVGRAIGDAVALDPREKGIPSSKGVL